MSQPEGRREGVAITLERLSIFYPTKRGVVHALHDVSCHICAGTFVALVGPSGCGKTSLLRAVGGMVVPYTGQIWVGEFSPDEARRRRMGSFLFQHPVLLPWKTAHQNVMVPLALRGVPRSQQHARATHMLQWVGGREFAEAYPHQLSGGMQQRVALARAWVGEPGFLLMDEPFSALDEFSREQLHRELTRIWSATRATVVFVTHSLSEAVFLADRVLVLSGHPGCLIADLPIPLPRPRLAALLTQPEFLHHVTTLRRHLGWET